MTSAAEAPPAVDLAAASLAIWANKNQLWTSQGSCRIEDRDEYQGESSEGKTRL